MNIEDFNKATDLRDEINEKIRKITILKSMLLEGTLSCTVYTNDDPRSLHEVGFFSRDDIKHMLAFHIQHLENVVEVLQKQFDAL